MGCLGRLGTLNDFFELAHKLRIRIGFVRGHLFQDALLGDRLDADLADAAAFHLHDGKTAAIVVDGFAGNGNVAKPGEHETRQRFHPAFARQVPLHLGLEVAKVGAAVQQQRACRVRENRAGGIIEFIFEFAGQLLDGVFRGYQANRRCHIRPRRLPSGGGASGNRE